MNPSPIDDPAPAASLDPSRVVPYRRWSDSTIDNDMRIHPPPAIGQDPTHSLWAAGLMNGPAATTEGQPVAKSWLAGLVKDEDEAPHSEASWLAGLVREEPRSSTPATKSWAGLPSEVDDAPTQPSALPTAWLAGLVKEEKRPAINDIARLLLGESAEAPGPPCPKSSPPPSPEAITPAPPTAPSPTSAPTEAPAVEPAVGPPAAAPVKESLPSLSGAASSWSKPGDEQEDNRPLRTAAPAKAKPSKPSTPAARRRPASIASRDKVSFYRSLSAMFDAGVPLFAIFEFLARDGENAHIGQACRRIGQSLVGGMPLPAAASQESQLFDTKAVGMLEVGYRGGQLSCILAELAKDEEHAWTMKQNLQSQLAYPCGIALITMAAVMLLPPLVLTGLLEQVISLTSKPPALTVWLLNLSAFVSSPWTMGVAAAGLVGFIWGLRTPRGKALLDNLELTVWFLPAIGQLWRNVVALRFLKVFAMTYKAGLPAIQGMELAASATGSQLAYRVYPLMKKTLLDGGTLAESFASGGFLPSLALEAIHAGEIAGKVPLMLENTALILTAEVQSRVDAVAKLIEPLVLACLGVIVGIFVLGCLLPIVELTSTL